MLCPRVGGSGGSVIAVVVDSGWGVEWKEERKKGNGGWGKPETQNMMFRC